MSHDLVVSAFQGREVAPLDRLAQLAPRAGHKWFKFRIAPMPFPMPRDHAPVGPKWYDLHTHSDEPVSPANEGFPPTFLLESFSFLILTSSRSGSSRFPKPLRETSYFVMFIPANNRVAQ